MNYLDVTPKHLEMNENIEGYKDKKLLKQLKEEKKIFEKTDKILNEKQTLGHPHKDNSILDKPSAEDLAIDFTTSSAISRVNVKFLIVYIPIFWLSGLVITTIWYWYSRSQFISNFEWSFFLFFPLILFGLIYIFILGCLLFSKLFLIIVNLIHKPKEGVFKAEIGNTDFEFWQLRTELKKIALWFFRNSPFPWTDVLAFKQLGVNMDSSSHLADAWCDSEFVKFGRKVMIGQGATIMSSMIVGKYLLIKNVIFDDYVMVGGHTTIAPGTVIGKESIIGAISSTTLNQVLKPAWIYFGIPAIELKENKYAEERRDIIIKREVADARKFELTHEVNIDDDKKKLIKLEEEMDEE
jgi:carbonic anhydrase/acetyltransferase-like protein (isoleucine patch superfamily)